jgi:hypothetical protein
MGIPESSPAQNRAGERFSPLPSAERAIADRFDAVELFASRVPPGVLANEVPVFAKPVPWPAGFGVFSDPIPNDLTQVIQLTLQVPQPIALVLGAWLPVPDRWRPATRIGAVNRITTGGTVLPAGRFIVEWGTGSARNFVFLDLAPGSLQIPVAQFVRVYAYVFSPAPVPVLPFLVAAASAYPGRQHPSPSATYTASVVQRAASPAVDTSIFDFLPPYCRTLTHSVAQTVSPPTAHSAVRLVDAASSASLMASVLAAPDLVPPFAPTVQAVPYAPRTQVVPGGVGFYRISLASLVAASEAGASAAFEVRL